MGVVWSMLEVSNWEEARCPDHSNRPPLASKNTATNNAIIKNVKNTNTKNTKNVKNAKNTNVPHAAAAKRAANTTAGV